MADRDLRLASNEEILVPLTQKERLEILRRLERVDQLKEEVRQLRTRLKERDRVLERLRRSAAALDATTPPSKKLHPPAELQARGCRPGGQPAHLPHTRLRPDHVNEIVDLTLDQYPDSHGTLGDLADAYERFVTELIPAYLWVLKILVHRYWCAPCDKFVQGETDRALPGRQFGPRLANTLGYR